MNFAQNYVLVAETNPTEASMIAMKSAEGIHVPSLVWMR